MSDPADKKWRNGNEAAWTLIFMAMAIIIIGLILNGIIGLW